MPLPPLPLPFCSSNFSSYPTHQNGSGQSLPHSWFWEPPLLLHRFICPFVHLSLHKCHIFRTHRDTVRTSFLFYYLGQWPLNLTLCFLSSLYVQQVKATDKDAGKNGQIKYKVLYRDDETKRFSVDPDTGVVTTTIPLDREDPSGNVVYGLIIQAEDQSEKSSRLSGYWLRCGGFARLYVRWIYLFINVINVNVF